jgi:hypothetical protein
MQPGILLLKKHVNDPAVRPGTKISISKRILVMEETYQVNRLGNWLKRRDIDVIRARLSYVYKFIIVGHMLTFQGTQRMFTLDVHRASIPRYMGPN